MFLLLGVQASNIIRIPFILDIFDPQTILKNIPITKDDIKIFHLISTNGNLNRTKCGSVKGKAKVRLSRRCRACAGIISGGLNKCTCVAACTPPLAHPRIVTGSLWPICLSGFDVGSCEVHGSYRSEMFYVAIICWEKNLFGCDELIVYQKYYFRGFYYIGDVWKQIY